LAENADFTFLDGERLVRFGRGALAEAAPLAAQRGFGDFALLTTGRARAVAPPDLVEAAGVVLDVPAGPVPDAAATVRPLVGGKPVVAFGGGRVIDSAKAIAAADGLPCAAIPTTLSGAPMTPFHRMPAGFDGYGLVRPALVVADPDPMASQSMPGLAASAMNAMAHAVESLYGPLANPVAELAALRAARLIARGLRATSPDRDALALGSILAGYAVGVAGFAIHHAVCQTIVRELATPHAETNAVMLPHSIGFMARRAPEAVGRLAAALGGGTGDPLLAGQLVMPLARMSARAGLGELGVKAADVPRVAAAVMTHPATANTPPAAPGRDDVEALVLSAI
jgi:alcohol dehydrogenase class IV